MSNTVTGNVELSNKLTWTSLYCGKRGKITRRKPMRSQEADVRVLPQYYP